MTRILLVEDSEMNRDMLSRRLHRKGFEVTIAVDGAEGLARAEGDQPDLILLDMSLPEVDGWDVAWRLKQSPATSGIPVIALTSHAMSGDREKCLEAGCDDYDTKPVEFNRLLTIIRKHLSSGPGQDSKCHPSGVSVPISPENGR